MSSRFEQHQASCEDCRARPFRPCPEGSKAFRRGYEETLQELSRDVRPPEAERTRAVPHEGL